MSGVQHIAQFLIGNPESACGPSNAALSLCDWNNGESFSDQIPGCLLRVFDLITTPDYSGQRSYAQDFRSGASVQAFEIRTLANARPQTTK